MRRRNKNTDEFVHGWRLIYALRDGRSSTRGDMTAIDPRDGQKIFSLIGVKRKLDCVEEVFEEAIRRGQEAAGVFDEGGRKRSATVGLTCGRSPTLSTAARGAHARSSTTLRRTTPRASRDCA